MPDRSITIKGVVIPFKWNASGQVTEVILAAHDEIEYRMVEPCDQSLLKDALHQLIEVRGAVTKKEEERPVLRILSYRKMEETGTE